MGLANARQLVRDAIAAALAPDPDLLVSEWADAHRIVSSKASGRPGKWDTNTVPYMREIMDAMSLTHPCTHGDFMKGTQIAGSEAMYNAIGYCIDKVPCAQMLVMPTVDMMKLTSRLRISTMIDETPALASKVGSQKSRESSNTTLQKEYPGGMLLMRGANSGPGLRSASVRVLNLDEVDAYPDDVDGEGDPCVLAEKRVESYGSRAKVFACSSPKIKGKSRIERRYQRGSRARYYVPCPHCAHEQFLHWNQIRWDMEQRNEHHCSACGSVTEYHDAAPAACAHCSITVKAEDLKTAATEDVANAWYECESCTQRIDEHFKTQMLERGRHIHEMPGPCEMLVDNDPHPHAIWARIGGQVKRVLPRYRRPLSWHVSALYSPLGWFSWRKAVQQKLEAQRGGYHTDSGESLEQVFYNTVLGETYEVKGEQPADDMLKLRAEPYDLGTVPAGALLLTASVDLQGDRFEVKVKGYGRGLESWLVDYHVIPYAFGAKQPGPDDWAKVLAVRDKGYPHASGNTLRITAMAVDSGYLTQEVLAFCRTYTHKHIIATKGSSARGKAIMGRPSAVDVNHNGKVIKGGVQLWHVGADTAKEQVYSRISITEPGPGYMHFPRNLPDEYYQQLTAEKVIRKRVKGAEVLEWVKTRERNEALDLEVLCNAAAIYAGALRANWDMLEKVVNPAQRDIFADAAQAKETCSEEVVVPENAATQESISVAAPGISETPASESSVSVLSNPLKMPRKNWITGFRT